LLFLEEVKMNLSRSLVISLITSLILESKISDQESNSGIEGELDSLYVGPKLEIMP
jgi:hypothetical protein